MKVSFRFPLKVNKVSFPNVSSEKEHLGFSDITDISSLSKVAT